MLQLKVKYENSLSYLIHEVDEQKRASFMQSWISSCQTEAQLNTCRVAVGILFEDEAVVKNLLEWCDQCQRVMHGKPLYVSATEIAQDGNCIVQLKHG